MFVCMYVYICIYTQNNWIQPIKYFYFGGWGLTSKNFWACLRLL